MEETLLRLLVALCVTDLLHNCFEIWGMRQKVQWLYARMHGRKHGNWPININTDLKAYGLHAMLFLTITGTTFLILQALSPTSKQLLIFGIVLLTASYIWMTTKVHFYHLEIGKLLRKFKRI